MTESAPSMLFAERREPSWLEKAYCWAQAQDEDKVELFGGDGATLRAVPAAAMARQSTHDSVPVFLISKMTNSKGFPWRFLSTRRSVRTPPIFCMAFCDRTLSVATRKIT